jgi:hypothetical protein
MKKKEMTVSELTSKAGKVGGRARANALTGTQREDIARLGGLAGGRARAKSLTAAERKEIARKAAAARWPHCPCGEMTAARAKATGHKCKAPK